MPLSFASTFTARTIGIEMEVTRERRNDPGERTQGTLPLANDVRGALARIGSETEVREMAYGHSDGRTWDAKTDSSCGYEVASPAIRLDAEGHNAELAAVCDVLGRTAKVTNACGLHVHVDVSDLSFVQFKRLLVLWARYEPFFFSLVPASRRGNHYCPAFRSHSWTENNQHSWNAEAFARAMQATDQRALQARLSGLMNRGALNLNNYWMSGRVEFRLHSGTVDYTKIRTWAMWLLALVAKAKDETSPVKLQTPKPLNPMSVCIARCGGLATAHVLRALNARDGSPIAHHMTMWATARRAQFSRVARVTRARASAGTTREASE